MDVVLSRRAWAGVGLRWAALGGRELGGRVGDVVALAAAGVALEDVEEPEPLKKEVVRCEKEDGERVLDLRGQSHAQWLGPVRSLVVPGTRVRTEYLHLPDDKTYIGIRQAPSDVHTPIKSEIIIRGVLEREVAKSQKAATKIAQEVEIERLVAALVQSRLHLQLCLSGLASSGPLVVGGEIDIDQVELEAGGAVGAVHDFDLQH